MNSASAELNSKKAESEKTITQLVYALQAASFLFVITFLIAVVINYVKKDDVENTWLASHFRWQIRTFWYSLLWIAVGFLTTLIVVGYIVLFANTIWLIYRIVKGWLRLADDKAMYTTD
ncbi:MAG: hypothetical protein KZQ90_16000 [Candidatus Thiodiazotropha sp. (ex Codakia rugifera)]|nr:hypothetical protein [Candidatus Thiodiazotropha sp. (ex Codakia rugifera)]